MGLCVVVMCVMGSHVRVHIWAGERITVCVSVGTRVRVAVCVHGCVGVCAVRVWAGAAAVRCLSVPIGGAAVAGRVILRELWVFRWGAMRGAQCSGAEGCHPG